MTKELIIGLVVGFSLFNLIFYLFSVVFASYRVFYNTLMRKSKEDWGRTLSIVNDLTLRMDAEGLVWQQEHDQYKEDVHICRDGFNLYGEFYHMGGNRAVIILSGRTESLRYGYYFARPYSQAGYNVLVVDPRAHGLSDGLYNTVGFEESGDAMAWAAFLQEQYGIDNVVFHGICIGAAAGMLAITSPECPTCVKGLVTEGMFVNFGESMKNHLIERKKLLFPVMQCIDYWFKRYTGHSMKRGPIDVIGRMDKPLLMIQSKKDRYSTPENAARMFSLCPSAHKEIVYYDTGDHSMLRITDTAKYDGAVTAFLERLPVAIEK